MSDEGYLIGFILAALIPLFIEFFFKKEMRKAKVTFSTELLTNISTLNFQLLNNDLNYPDNIGGEYYFNLSDKEKKKYKLTNPEFLLKHFDYRKIFDLNINEQI